MTFQWRWQIWCELHLIKSLPEHPNLVSLDRVVLDDVESRFLGFTTAYIPGGSLDENRERVFRLEWLQQLTPVVDYLNLVLGIPHQDVSPRKSLIDPETDEILLFDFDRAARIGQPGCIAERNDVPGVISTLYGIVTHDEHFREAPFMGQGPETVQNLGQWPVMCKLDGDISIFRKHLNDWVRGRTEIPGDSHVQVNVSDTPTMPPPTPLFTGHDEEGKPVYDTNFTIRRTDLMRLKHNVIPWERPPQQEVNLQKGIKRRNS